MIELNLIDSLAKLFFKIFHKGCKNMEGEDVREYKVKCIEMIIKCIFNNVNNGHTLGLSHQSTCFYSDVYAKMYHFGMTFTS